MDTETKAGEPKLVATVEPPSHTTLAIATGARYFARTPTVLGALGVEVGLPWFRIGVRAAVGDATVTLGTLEPYLVTLTLARSVVCHTGATSFCLVARVEGGVAGVMAQPRSAMLATATSASAPFGLAEVAAELGHSFTTWSVFASVEAGWAEGMVARAGGTDAAALAGSVYSGSIGARWR